MKLSKSITARYFAIATYLRRCRNQVSNGVHDDRGETGGGDPVESIGQTVESDDDYDGRDDTSGRCAHTGLGFEGGAREGSSCRVGAEARADGVSDTNGDELLVWVDLVPVEATEG